MSNKVDFAEQISRFMFEEKNFKKPCSNCQDGEVKWRAFTPQKGSSEVSVDRSSGLNFVQLKDLGNQVGQTRSKQVLACANLTVKEIVEANVGLKVVKDPTLTDDRHALITPWPIKRDDLSLEESLRVKEEIQNKATALALVARLQLLD